MRETNKQIIMINWTNAIMKVKTGSRCFTNPVHVPTEEHKYGGLKSMKTSEINFFYFRKRSVHHHESGNFTQNFSSKSVKWLDSFHGSWQPFRGHLWKMPSFNFTYRRHRKTLWDRTLQKYLEVLLLINIKAQRFPGFLTLELTDVTWKQRNLETVRKQFRIHRPKGHGKNPIKIRRDCFPQFLFRLMTFVL